MRWPQHAVKTRIFFEAREGLAQVRLQAVKEHQLVQWIGAQHAPENLLLADFRHDGSQDTGSGGAPE